MTLKWHILAAETIERRLEFASLPQGWISIASIMILAAMLYLAVLFYRREQRAGLTAGMRAVLVGLRCSVIALLAAVWLEPVLATYLHRRIDSETLVLMDASASMSLHDRYADPQAAALVPPVPGDPRKTTRAELAWQMLAGGETPLLARLAARNPVRLYRFAEDAEPLAFLPRGQTSPAATTRPAGGGDQESTSPAGMSAMPGPAQGLATDLGKALRSAVEMAGDTPIAAIVVLSDGRFNRGEPAEIVGRFAQTRRIPIYAVGAGDPSEPRNASIESLDAPAGVFVKDPFQVTVRVQAQGLAGKTLTIELLAGDDPDRRPLDRRTVVADDAGRVPPVVFKHQLAEAGETRLLARIAPIEGETLTADNQRDLTVRALDDRMRVLLVAGGPGWEYRYLARLLARDATMDLSCWLQSADQTAVRDGKTVIDRFPSRPEELAPYDCIILIDPQERDFSPEWTSAVEAMIANNGTGLLYVAGRTFTPRFVRSPQTRSLIELLPVVIEPGESDLILNELGHFQTTAWPVVVPAEAAGHPVLAMQGSTSENLQTWSRLPGWYWHYPARRAKPVATVLLRHSDPRMRGPEGGHVLLATQFVGSGRTGFLAADSTWRWRRAGEQYFNRFWVQLLRHLVEGKLLAGQKRGLIQTERDRYAVGDAVIVEARLLDDRSQPLKVDQVTATVLRENQPVGTIAMSPQPQRPGWYRGKWVPPGEGLYTIQIDLPAEPGAEPAAVRRDLRVGQADIEFRQTSLDRESLRLLAGQSAGGQYLDLAEANRLADLIPGRQVSLVLTGEPVPLWDRWWTLAILVALLGAEWFLRKRAYLL